MIGNQRNGLIKINNTLFSNNTIKSSATGLIAIQSVIGIEATVSFINNTGYYGGGLLLLETSTVQMYSNAKLEFIGNHGKEGGGLYSDTVYDECVFYTTSNSDYATIEFIDNNAIVGDDMYGIDLNLQYCHAANDIKQATTANEICFCSSNFSLSNCISQVPKQQVFPGQTII